MKLLLTILLLFALTACQQDFNVDARVNDAVYRTDSYEVFEGIVNGEPVEFRTGAGFYYCNPTDQYVYETDTNAAVLNVDSTQAGCIDFTYGRTEFSQQQPVLPLYSG